MTRIYAIALNTYREAVRDRVLHGVLGAAICVLLFTLVLAELSLDQRERVVTDVGLASISLFSVIVSVFLGSSLLYKEIERKTLYVILPKPIRRWQFLVGKYFGIVLTSLVFVCVMGSIQLLVTAVQTGVSVPTVIAVACGAVVVLGVGFRFASDKTAIVIPWAVAALAAAGLVASQGAISLTPILASLVLCLGEVLLLASVALVFSAFSTPFLTGAFTVGIWLVGRSADSLVHMRGNLFPLEVKKVLAGLAWVLPNFNLFVPGRHVFLEAAAAHGGPVLYVAQTMGYAVLASFVLLALASAIFERRDFI